MKLFGLTIVKQNSLRRALELVIEGDLLDMTSRQAALVDEQVDIELNAYNDYGAQISHLAGLQLNARDDIATQRENLSMLSLLAEL